MTTQTNDQPQFEAFIRMMKTLEESGIDEKSRAFILGRLLRQVADRTLSEISEVLKDQLVSFETIADLEEKQKKIDELYFAAKGISLDQFRDQIAAEIVRDFEAQE